MGFVRSTVLTFSVSDALVFSIFLIGSSTASHLQARLGAHTCGKDLRIPCRYWLLFTLCWQGSLAGTGQLSAVTVSSDTATAVLG